MLTRIAAGIVAGIVAGIAAGIAKQNCRPVLKSYHFAFLEDIVRCPFAVGEFIKHLVYRYPYKFNSFRKAGINRFRPVGIGI